jgi:uncharacterized protein YbjT (DUF2867 family)
MRRNIAVVIGATGLTGLYLMNVLAEDAFYDRVLLLTRRPAEPPEILSKSENVHVDFERLELLDLAGATHVFSCLGTTIGNAGSREAFRRVDHDYVVAFARAARRAGARHMSFISSVGAHPRAASFYLRVKGETEQALAALGFEALHIFRPSILLGKRNQRRPAEELWTALARGFEWLMLGPFGKFRPMPAPVLASAMAAAGERGGPGRHIHHYDGIIRLAGV